MKLTFRPIVWTLLFSLQWFPSRVFSQEFFLDDGIYFEKPVTGDGIWTEKANYADTSMHKYTRDNLSYKLGNVFIYDYYYLDASGKKKKFLLTKNESSTANPLNLVDYDQLTDSTIERIMLRVTDKREDFKACDSSCTQTTICYSYLIKNKKAKSKTDSKNSTGNRYISCEAVSTGVIDNKKNIWMHPPRQFTFRILQLSPFPFYQQQEDVMHWAWNVTVNGVYLDARWIPSKEKITVRTDYERKKDEKLATVFGDLSCKVTTATAILRSANFETKTYLKSYYHQQYGFLKLEYTLVNGAKMIIDLIEKQD